MNKANYCKVLLHWKAHGISWAQALSLAEKEQLLSTAVLDVGILSKAKAQGGTAEVDGGVSRPRKLKTLLIECECFFGEWIIVCFFPIPGLTFSWKSPCFKQQSFYFNVWPSLVHSAESLKSEHKWIGLGGMKTSLNRSQVWIFDFNLQSCLHLDLIMESSRMKTSKGARGYKPAPFQSYRYVCDVQAISSMWLLMSSSFPVVQGALRILCVGLIRAVMIKTLLRDWERSKQGG